jgi:hypothetical protein
MDKILCLITGFCAGVVIASLFYKREDRGVRKVTCYGDHWKEEGFIHKVVERIEHKKADKN